MPINEVLQFIAIHLRSWDYRVPQSPRKGTASRMGGAFSIVGIEPGINRPTAFQSQEFGVKTTGV